MLPRTIEEFIKVFSSLPSIGQRQATRLAFYLIAGGNKKIQELSQIILNLSKNIRICERCFLPFEFENESSRQAPHLSPQAKGAGQARTVISHYSSSEAANGGRVEKLCSICSDPTRNQKIICVVEKETDLISLEKTRQLQGVYHILGGTISPTDPETYKKIRLKELVNRIKTQKVNELIIATNPTTAGELTAMYVERVTKNLVPKITYLGRGLPTGGEIEFADEETLKSAFEGRK